ncbi:MAG: DUF1189 domain-containing protein, partial [Clostridiales bacterium]|nr:DUF1189 domain-containing protein [Clostridiales bacterium]
GFFNRIFYSIAGFKYYKVFPSQSTGKAVVYLLLLALIVGAASLVLPLVYFNTAIDEMTLQYDSKVPDFTFSNGELKVSGSMPIKMDGGSMTIIIDTSSDDDSILDNYDSAMLITKTRMIQKSYEKKQVTNFSMIPGLNTDKAKVKQLLPLLKWFSVLIGVFGLIFFVAGKYISVFIAACLGAIIARALGLILPFRDLFVMSAYAVTLPLIVCTLIGFLPVTIPYLWVLYYLIAGVYLWGGLNSIKRDMPVQPM